MYNDDQYINFIADGHHNGVTGALLLPGNGLGIDSLHRRACEFKDLSYLFNRRGLQNIYNESHRFMNSTK